MPACSSSHMQFLVRPETRPGVRHEPIRTQSSKRQRELHSRVPGGPAACCRVHAALANRSRVTRSDKARFCASTRSLADPQGAAWNGPMNFLIPPHESLGGRSLPIRSPIPLQARPIPSRSTNSQSDRIVNFPERIFATSCSYMPSSNSHHLAKKSGFVE